MIWVGIETRLKTCTKKKKKKKPGHPRQNPRYQFKPPKAQTGQNTVLPDKDKQERVLIAIIILYSIYIYICVVLFVLLFWLSIASLIYLFMYVHSTLYMYIGIALVYFLLKSASCQRNISETLLLHVELMAVCTQHRQKHLDQTALAVCSFSLKFPPARLSRSPSHRPQGLTFSS